MLGCFAGRWEFSECFYAIKHRKWQAATASANFLSACVVPLGSVALINDERVQSLQPHQFASAVNDNRRTQMDGEYCVSPSHLQYSVSSPERQRRRRGAIVSSSAWHGYGHWRHAIVSSRRLASGQTPTSGKMPPSDKISSKTHTHPLDKRALFNVGLTGTT